MTLREAHTRRSAAVAEVEKRQGAVDKAREFLRLAEERLAGIETALTEREQSIIARLTDSFRGLAAGADNGEQQRLGPLRASKAQAEGEIAVAKAALDQVEAELIAAQQVLARAEADVFGAVVDVMLWIGEECAETILAAEAELQTDRIRLDALARAVADRERAAGRAALSHFGDSCWRALHDPNGRALVLGSMQGDVGEWRHVLDALMADPGAHPELAALPADPVLEPAPEAAASETVVEAAPVALPAV